MKTNISSLLAAAVCGLFTIVNSTQAQGTAITYQGQLQNNGAPANGTYNLTFSLYDSASGGNLLAGPFGTNRVNITNGLFTVLTDFGTGPWNIGSNVWLTIGVETNGGGAFTTLAPRQQVTPTPYAIYTESAGSAISATNFSGSVGGDVTGTQGATVVTTVGGQTAASIAQGVVAANNATPSSVPNTIVARDTNGNISANSLTLGGSLNLPYPAILSSGGTNFMMEDGSLYAGVHNQGFVIQARDLFNTGFGDYALEYEATAPIPGTNGMYNTAVGEYALTDNQSGWANTAVGYDALEDNQTGFANTAVGFESLMNMNSTNGTVNTAVGFRALWANSSGGGNTANGAFALLENETGSNNTAIGLAALEYNTGGYDNTASGFGALTLNETGFENTADGVQALNQNRTGSYNTASGFYALFWNSNGCQNTASGSLALWNNWSGSNNTAIGAQAAYLYNTNGSDLTAVGYNALAYAVNDSRAVAIGESALMNDNSYAYAGTNSGISENTAVGYQALEQNNSGTGNTAEGYQSLLNNTNGNQNTAVGVSALLNNTSGAQNTADGAQSLLNNTSGSYNTANGAFALYANTDGTQNTADGDYTLYNNTSGSFNTAVGYGALPSSQANSNNTAIGYYALSSFQSGTNNIALGYQAGSSLSYGSSNIYIGNPGVNGDNHAIRIGDVTDTNTTVTVIAGIFNGTLGSAGTEVMVDSSGHLGVRVSSAKFKHDIQPMGDVSDVLLKLKPVTFKYNADRDPSGTPEFGLVAEQVNEVDPDLVVRDANHQVYTVRYEAVNAMLLNEFLKQHQTVEAQNAEISDLKARLEKMEQIVSDERTH